MIDWNGNGRIDPTDIGISIAAETEDEEWADNEMIEEPYAEETTHDRRSHRTHSLRDNIRSFFSRILDR